MNWGISVCHYSRIYLIVLVFFWRYIQRYLVIISVEFRLSKGKIESFIMVGFYGVHMAQESQSERYCTCENPVQDPYTDVDGNLIDMFCERCGKEY